MTTMQSGLPRVLAFGETMLMFAPPEHELIEHSEQFRAFIGGSEVNVAVGLQRLGIHAGWVGKLPHNALGCKVVNGIRRYGVNTSGVVWADGGRVGTFYVERGAKPRPTRTIYDRAGSAFTTLTADEMDWDIIGQAEWLHLTGITPALSQTCRHETPRILARARELGVKVSIDLNYRSKLWSPAEAREAWRELMPYVNLLIATEPDAGILLGESLQPEDTLRRLYDEHQPEAVVLTCRGNGSMAFDGNGIVAHPSFPLEPVNRIGAGDAFDAGLLYGLINADLETGLAYGNAMAVLKFTIPQNLPLINREDVEALVGGQAGRRLVR